MREYLDEFGAPELVEAFNVRVRTRGPSGRFGGVFFAEKEGFDALFEQVHPQLLLSGLIASKSDQ